FVVHTLPVVEGYDQVTSCILSCERRKTHGTQSSVECSCTSLMTFYPLAEPLLKDYGQCLIVGIEKWQGRSERCLKIRFKVLEVSLQIEVLGRWWVFLHVLHCS